MTRRGATAVLALAAILVISAAWWALALWPTGGVGPAWLEATRAACFGTRETGLPNAGGWVLLIGEPIGMLGFLLVVWGDAVGEGLSSLWRTVPGRVLVSAGGAGVALGLGLAVIRVRDALAEPPALLGHELPAARLNRTAPGLSLVDQDGVRVEVADFKGRPVVLTFGYGHCETVCPVVVREARLAVERVPGAVLLVVTLDPWRDVPSRLAPIAAAWKLPAGARLLGGAPDEVESALDAWDVARSRDPDTGVIEHATPVYLLDREGRIAYLARGDTDQIVTLLETL